MKNTNRSGGQAADRMTFVRGVRTVSEKRRIFEKFKVKDIVFLAVISAAMLLTGAVMPLVMQVHLFGIIQLALGLQFSFFPAVGLMKVRKTGSLLFISVCGGAVLIFFNMIMFFCMLICAVVSEAIAVLLFKGYKCDIACFVAAAIYLPLSLPFLYVWYSLIGQTGTVAMFTFAGDLPWLTALMSFASLALSLFGSFVGVKIAGELRKSGVIKN